LSAVSATGWPAQVRIRPSLPFSTALPSIDAVP
jgi:hypothetical protein